MLSSSSTSNTAQDAKNEEATANEEASAVGARFNGFLRNLIGSTGTYTEDSEDRTIKAIDEKLAGIQKRAQLTEEGDMEMGGLWEKVKRAVTSIFHSKREASEDQQAQQAQEGQQSRQDKSDQQGQQNQPATQGQQRANADQSANQDGQQQGDDQHTKPRPIGEDPKSKGPKYTGKKHHHYPHGKFIPDNSGPSADITTRDNANSADPEHSKSSTEKGEDKGDSDDKKKPHHHHHHDKKKGKEGGHGGSADMASRDAAQSAQQEGQTDEEAQNALDANRQQGMQRQQHENGMQGQEAQENQANDDEAQREQMQAQQGNQAQAQSEDHQENQQGQEGDEDLQAMEEQQAQPQARSLKVREMQSPADSDRGMGGNDERVLDAADGELVQSEE